MIDNVDIPKNEEKNNKIIWKYNYPNIDLKDKLILIGEYE